MKKDVPSICLINARSNRSYIGVYKNNDCLLVDQVLSNDDVKKYINDHQDYCVCGDCAYLQIEGYKADLLANMYFLKNSSNQVQDLYTLKATYLKY